MSDTDSLDGLLDDIDMDALLDSKEEVSSSVSGNINNNGKEIKNEADLDDLLDDFFEEDAAAGTISSVTTTSGKDTSTTTSDDIDDDGDLAAHLQLQKTHDLERALHTLPSADMKKKWMSILKDDIKLNETPSSSSSSSSSSSTSSSSPFKRSYSYLEWQDPVEHFAADKSLRNLILRACSKSNMSDTQAKRLQDILFHDPVLLKKYCHQIVQEKSKEIKDDEDFSQDKYPCLWKSLI